MATPNIDELLNWLETEAPGNGMNNLIAQALQSQTARIKESAKEIEILTAEREAYASAMDRMKAAPAPQQEPILHLLRNIANGVRMYGAPDKDLLADRLSTIASDLAVAQAPQLAQHALQDVDGYNGATTEQLADRIVVGQPAWISVKEMADQPKAWYWAEFPGTWIWFSPERNAARGIDFGDLTWHSLQSKRYFGPWHSPAGNLPESVDDPDFHESVFRD